MIGLFSILIVFAAFAALSVAFGADSRIDSADPHRPDYPIGIR
jgi:hypothetical protein